MLLDEVVGHQRVIDLLRREVDQPANAYLFVGASGIGKATVATGFAQMLLCPESGSHEESCRSCRRVLSGNHPDLIEITLEGRQSIGVEQARNLVQAANLTPVESAIKVFVIPEAGTMTEQAANALLKTLEEPTETTIFLLVAESEEDLPSTVNSRCRTIHLGRVPDELVTSALVARGVDQHRAEALARVAGGKPGMAVTLSSDTDIEGYRSHWLGLPGRFSERPGEASQIASEVEDWIAPLATRAVERLSDDLTKDERERERKRTNSALLEAGLEILATWYADAAAIQYGSPLRNPDLSVADLTSISPATAVRNAEMVLDAVTDLNANLRPHLLLTNLFTRLAL